MNTKWSDVELAYLAGIVDGEGCISMSFHGRTKSSASTQIYVGNTNERLIHWLHAKFGGTLAIRKAAKSNHKPLWRWLLSGHDVEVLLSEILPYLILKREQATLVLEFRSTVNPTGSSQRITDEIKDMRRGMKAKMLTLNRRGIA